jgi:chromate reductase
MAYTPRILAFAGSAREGSLNKMLAKRAAEAARKAGADVTFLDLRDLPMPLFDEDLEKSLGDEQPDAKKFKDLLRAHDGWLLASPENNGSYSALLKNAIDWASRKRAGEKPLECFADKAAALMSASPSWRGGLRGLVHVRMTLQDIRMHVLPDQVTIMNAHEAFNEDGSLKDPRQQASVEDLARQLVAFIAKQKS